MNDPVKLDIAWSSPPDRPYLSQAEIQVWLVRLDEPELDIERCKELISAPERNRAASFKFDRDRRRYLVAHAALRSILATYLPSVSPTELEFLAGFHGKPKLAPRYGKETVRFNLSHSHEVAVVAVTTGAEIGVDIEYIKEDFAFEEVAKRFFSSSEIKALSALPHEFRRVAFFKCWTSKEAYLKAKGTGLSGKLDEVELVLTPEHSVRVKGTIENWALTEIVVNENYVAAVVAEGNERELRCYHWRSGAAG